MLRKVIVMLEVDEGYIDDEDMGTLEYVEQELGWVNDSGIYCKDARILDDDDEEDAEAIKMADEIFEGK